MSKAPFCFNYPRLMMSFHLCVMQTSKGGEKHRFKVGKKTTTLALISAPSPTTTLQNPLSITFGCDCSSSNHLNIQRTCETLEYPEAHRWRGAPRRQHRGLLSYRPSGTCQLSCQLSAASGPRRGKQLVVGVREGLPFECRRASPQRRQIKRSCELQPLIRLGAIKRNLLSG